jgi:hypothetical protein
MLVCLCKDSRVLYCTIVQGDIQQSPPGKMQIKWIYFLEKIKISLKTSFACYLQVSIVVYFIIL